MYYEPKVLADRMKFHVCFCLTDDTTNETVWLLCEWWISMTEAWLLTLLATTGKTSCEKGACKV